MPPRPDLKPGSLDMPSRHHHQSKAEAALTALDNATFSWFHVKAIILAGSGFMADAYDLFCIGMLTKLLGRIYYTSPVCTQSSTDQSWTCKISSAGAMPASSAIAVTVVALVGTLCGQLVWGRLGDLIGRKNVYGVSLALMLGAALGSAMSFGLSADAVIGSLCFWRFVLGFGIGGGYPMSAVIMSEESSKHSRGSYLAAVFAMQGTGYLLAATVVIIVTKIFQAGNPSASCPFANPSTDCKGNHGFQCYPLCNVSSSYEIAHANVMAAHGQYIKPSDDYVWRTILALGCLPAMLTIYHQMQMPESARYTALVKQRADEAALDRKDLLGEIADQVVAEPDKNEVAPKPLMTWTEFWAHKKPNFLWQLLGTTSTWFFLDVAFYSQGLYQNTIYSTIGWVPDKTTLNALDETYLLARAQAIVTLSSAIPGYWVSVALMDRLGRFPITVIGFVMTTLLMGLMAGLYSKLTTADTLPAFIVLYCLTFFFMNFGPNTTTYILPAELYPAHFRSTCHGISAAWGKAGAIIGATGFSYASQDPIKPSAGYPAGIGLPSALGILAATNFIGLICTLLFTPETKGKSLEELNGTHFDDEQELKSVDTVPMEGAVPQALQDIAMPPPGFYNKSDVVMTAQA